MKLWVLVLATSLLTGCATKAYRAVEGECKSQAWLDYPEQKVQAVQTRQRWVHVATGMQNCYAYREGQQTHTVCHPITRPEFITYQEAVVVDQNEAVRNMAIVSCSANLCLQRYGNAKCKTDQLLVPLSSPESVSAPVPRSMPMQ
jgi:alpha-tubulin suppressor-like RCC1 family protein